MATSVLIPFPVVGEKVGIERVTFGVYFFVRVRLYSSGILQGTRMRVQVRNIGGIVCKKKKKKKNCYYGI
jgi:hypothetical protein